MDNDTTRLDEFRLGDRAVRTTFSAAYEELSGTDRTVFRRAGSDPGQVFDLDTATARCDLDRSVVRTALDRLADEFLVETPAPDTYRLHDLLRLFATERLGADETPEERVGCLARQLDELTGRARRGRLSANERDTVLSVLRVAVEAGLAEPAWQLVTAVGPQLTAMGEQTFGARLWQAGEAASVALGDDRRRIRALRRMSHLYGLAGEVQRELPPAEHAVRLAAELGDVRESAQSLRRLGEALRGQSRFAEAETALNRALTLFGELGDVSEEIEVRAALGNAYNMQWKPQASTPILERAAELLPPREAGIHGWVYLSLGLAYKFGGRGADAAALIERAFGVARRIGDDYLLGYCFQERGWLHEQNARYPEAEQDFRAMLALFTRAGNAGGASGARAALGAIADKQGRYAEAVDEFTAGIAELDRLGDRVRAGELRLHRSAALRSLGRRAEADRDRDLGTELIGDANVHLGPILQARLTDQPVPDQPVPDQPVPDQPGGSS